MFVVYRLIRDTTVIMVGAWLVVLVGLVGQLIGLLKLIRVSKVC